MEELFSGIVKFFFGGLTSLIVNPIRNMFAAFMSMEAAWRLKMMYRIAPNVGRSITRALIKTYFDQTDVWLPLIQQYIEQMTGSKMDIGPIAILDANKSKWLATQALADGLINKLIDTIAPKKAITPTQALENAKNFFAVNLSFQMSAWMLHWIGDTFSLGSMKSLKDLPNAISWSFGLGWLSWLAMGTPFKKAISDPLDLYYNRVYQSERLSKNEMIDYLFRSGADANTWKDVMKDYGLNPENTVKLLEASYKYMTLSDAEKAMRLGIISENTFKSYLLHQGYHPTHADILYKLAKQEVIESTLRKIADNALEAYAKGLIDKSTVKQILTDCKYSPEEQDLMIIQRDFQNIADKTLTTSQVLQAYREGVLTLAQTKDRLKRMGYNEEDIDILLKIEKRELSVGEIQEALVRQLIDENKAKEKLRKLGYSDEDIDILINLRTIPLSIGNIIDLYERKAIDDGTAKDLLKKRGLNPFLIDLVMRLARKRLDENDVIKALFRGIISESEALSRLEQLGYSRGDAEILIKTSYRLISLADLEYLFYDQKIHRTDVANYLELMGFRPEDIPRILDLHFRPFRIWAQDPNTGQWYQTNIIWE